MFLVHYTINHYHFILCPSKIFCLTEQFFKISNGIIPFYNKLKWMLTPTFYRLPWYNQFSNNRIINLDYLHLSFRNALLEFINLWRTFYRVTTIMDCGVGCRLFYLQGYPTTRFSKIGFQHHAFLFVYSSYRWCCYSN